MSLLSSYLPEFRYLGAQDLIQTDGALFLNVKEDYGALGNDTADDRAAIQNAINACQASAYGGVIYFPYGKYKCFRDAGIPVFSLVGATIKPMMFIGDGIASEIKVAGTIGGDCRLFDCQNGLKYITWRNLKLSSALTTETEQQHLLHWENKSTSTDNETGRCQIIDVYFGHTRGDQARFLGNNTKRVKNITFERCYGSNFGGAVRTRTCYSWQRAADDIRVIDAYCNGDNAGSIDFEPTGTGSNERNSVIDCHFDNAAVSFTGNGSGQEHIHSHFVGNTVLGSFDGLDMENIIIALNIIDNASAGAGIGCMSGEERIHGVMMSDNILRRTNDTGDSPAASVISIDSHSVGENKNLMIVRNLVENENNRVSGGGISLRALSGAVVRNNMIFVKNNTANNGFAIRSENPVETITDLHFANNLGVGTNTDLGFGTGGGVGNFSVLNTLHRKIQQGVSTGGAAFAEQAICARNVMPGSSNTVKLASSIPTYICIDGTPSAKGIGMYLTSADPTTASGIPAGIGSIALRTNGSTSTTLYVKTGSGNTNWTAK